MAIVPEPPGAASTSRLNLLPRDARASASPWTRWQFWLPLGALVAAALAAAIIPVWQKRDYAIQLNAVVQQERGRAGISEALRQELDARVGDFNFALERKYAYPSALAVVDTVSKLLPDDTWLTQFELKTVAKGKESQRELLVRGESANAGRLVQLFEESQLFAQAAPRSPTTKIQPGPGEIFDLGAQLKSLPPPVSVQILATSDASGAPSPAAPALAPTPAPGNAPAAPGVTPGTTTPPSGGTAPAPTPASTPAPAKPATAPPPATTTPASGAPASGATTSAAPAIPARPANAGSPNASPGAPPAATPSAATTPMSDRPVAATPAAAPPGMPDPADRATPASAPAAGMPDPANRATPAAARVDRGNGASPIGGSRP